MSLHSDSHGYRSNVYTTIQDVNNIGCRVNAGETGIKIGVDGQQVYVNNFVAGDVISSDDYARLSDDEKTLYKPSTVKADSYVFNIDQTTLTADAARYQDAAGDNRTPVDSPSLDVLKADFAASVTDSSSVDRPLTFFKSDGSFVCFGGDATDIAALRLCESVVPSSDLSDATGTSLPMASIAEDRFEQALQQLVDNGRSVQVYDRLEDLRGRYKQEEVSVVYDDTRALISTLESDPKVKAGMEPSHYDRLEDRLYINLSCHAPAGRGLFVAMSRSSELYHSVAAYLGSRERLDVRGFANALPEYHEKYAAFVLELSAAVMQLRHGLPAFFSDANKGVIPYFIYEMRQDPSLLEKVERDVNRTVAAIEQISNGHVPDYTLLREGDDFVRLSEKQYSIANGLTTFVSADLPDVVIVKDPLQKSAAVILPMSSSTADVSKNDYVLALTKEGFKSVSFYTGGGKDALIQPNSFFEGKEVSVGRLSNQHMDYTEVIDLHDEIRRSAEVTIIRFQLLKNDDGHPAFFIQTDDGRSVTVYPQDEDLEFFKSHWSQAATADGWQELEHLARQYVTVVQDHPEVDAGLLRKDDYDYNRVTDISISKDPDRNSTFVMVTAIDHVMRDAITLSSIEMERLLTLRGSDRDEELLRIVGKNYGEILSRLPEGEQVTMEDVQEQPEAQHEQRNGEEPRSATFRL